MIHLFSLYITYTTYSFCSVMNKGLDHVRFFKGCVFSVGRCCGVRAVTHIQSCGRLPSCGHRGCPGTVCASGCAGGRHSDRPCRSLPGKTSALLV